MTDDEKRLAQRALIEAQRAKKATERGNRRPPEPERVLRGGGVPGAAMRSLTKSIGGRHDSSDGQSVYDGAELTQDRARFWLAMDAWAVDEAAFLLCAIDPKTLNHWAMLNDGKLAVGFPEQFDDVQALLRRAADAGTLRFPAPPRDVIEWAMAKCLRLPSSLIPNGAAARGGRWVHQGTGAEDPRHDPEEALRLIKAAHLGGKAVVAHDGDDEAKAIAAKIETERELRRLAEAKRIAEGRYFIDEAAKAIATQRGLGDQWALQFRDAMVVAAERHDLTVRDPSTWLPVPRGQRISLARIVTPEDVNQWLVEQGAGYRWEGADASMLESDTPESEGELLYPLDQAATTMAHDQWPDTVANRVWAAEAWRVKYPDQQAPTLNGKVSEESYLAHLIHDTERELQEAIDRLLDMGLLTLRSPNSQLPTSSRQGALVSRQEIVGLMKDGKHLSHQSATAEDVPKPLQRQQAQEIAILAKLAELGIDAQAVPAAPAGRVSTAKQAVREALGYSADVMNKAWQRLRNDLRIKDA